MEKTPTASSPALNLLFPLLLVLAPLLFLIFKHFTPSPPSLPPGPKPWPILGNLIQIGKRPHVSLTHFADLHGPLISLKLGTQLVVIGSSPAAAAEILKTHDALLSARSPPEATNIPGLETHRLSLVWADCNDRWRLLRSLIRTELLSGKALDSTAAERRKKVSEMMEFLSTKQGQVVKIAEVVSVTVYNSMTSLMFSEDFCCYGEEGPGRLKEVLAVGERQIGYAGNIAEYYPIFSKFDLQGIKKEGLALIKQLYAIWEHVIKQRRERTNTDDTQQHKDLLDVLLAKGFADDQINYLIPEILSAATDTTTKTVEWAMAELVKNQEAMTKLGDELKREANQDCIKESDLFRLPYLLACVMETLRLHPPVPFLLPHRAIETCQVMGYTIPKGTRVLVNVYAIGRDPAAWEDPLSYKPERFLHPNKVNFQGLDFEYIPFGSGRRMCPGQSLGVKQVLLILAHLVHCFDWCLPDNVELDMNEKLFLTLHKEQPLCLVPRKKL